MNGELLKGHLDLLILAVVARRAAHGYAIIAALRDESDGAFDLPEGTVYPALHRLERGGLLRSEWAVADGRKRRVYALTTAGSTALNDRAAEWHSFASGVRAVLGGAV